MVSKFYIRRRSILQSLFKMLLVYCLLEPAVQATIPNCYPLQSDFKTACETGLNGLVVGSQCYYPKKGSEGDWEKAWTTCTADGSIVAQFQTIKEQQELKELQRARGILSTNIGLRDEGPFQSCCTITDTTQYYDDVTTPNTKLTTSNTVLKYYSGSAAPTKATPYNTASPTCMGALLKGHTCTLPGFVASATPLCQFTNMFQNFTLTTYCMTETPVETVTVSSIQSCPNECAQRHWCRSFNYDTSNGGSECELFARSIDDGTPDATKMPAVAPQSPTCAHYNHA